MAQVKLILSEDIPSLGDAGDVVSVKPGFARNYLVPQGKAIHASEGKIQEVEHHKRAIAEKVAKEKGDQEKVRNRVEALTLEVEAQAGEEGKLFGSVTAANIAALLAENGVEVDRRKVQLKDPIKEVGEHTVGVRLHREIIAQVKVVVRSIGAPPTAEIPDDIEEPIGTGDSEE